MIFNRKAWFLAGVFGLSLVSSQAYAASGNIEILREGLLGAGVGAISAGTSGGKAGLGALIGAGTAVLGNVLLGIITNNPQQGQPYYDSQVPVYQQPVYQQPVYQTVQIQRPVYYRTEPTYVSAPSPTTYSYAPREDYNKRVLKQGLLGAGVGAISAETSGGKAGTGALVGAGSNVLGSALLEYLTNGV